MVETITPNYAKELLKNNTDNRNPKKNHINNLAYMMKKGQWVLNGEAIIIAKDGTILDGQHRLMAVIESETNIESIIIRGINKNVMHTIDSGVGRTTADSLKINGYENSTALAKMARQLILFRRKKTLRESRSRDQNVSNKDILELIEKEPKICSSFSDIGIHSLNSFLSRSDFALYWYIFKDIDLEKANEFVYGLIKGVGLEENSPIFIVRNKLIQDKMRNTSNMAYSYKVKLIFKAWDLFYKNKKVKNIRVNPESDIIYPTEYKKYY